MLAIAEVAIADADERLVGASAPGRQPRAPEASSAKIAQPWRTPGRRAPAPCCSRAPSADLLSAAEAEQLVHHQDASANPPPSSCRARSGASAASSDAIGAWRASGAARPRPRPTPAAVRRPRRTHAEPRPRRQQERNARRRRTIHTERRRRNRRRSRRSLVRGPATSWALLVVARISGSSRRSRWTSAWFDAGASLSGRLGVTPGRVSSAPGSASRVHRPAVAQAVRDSEQWRSLDAADQAAAHRERFHGDQVVEAAWAAVPGLAIDGVRLLCMQERTCSRARPPRLNETRNGAAGSAHVGKDLDARSRRADARMRVTRPLRRASGSGSRGRDTTVPPGARCHGGSGPCSRGRSRLGETSRPHRPPLSPSKRVEEVGDAHDVARDRRAGLGTPPVRGDARGAGASSSIAGARGHASQCSDLRTRATAPSSAAWQPLRVSRAAWTSEWSKRAVPLTGICHVDIERVGRTPRRRIEALSPYTSISAGVGSSHVLGERAGSRLGGCGRSTAFREGSG